MTTIKATYDGHAFVPVRPVELPVGQIVEVVIHRQPPVLTEEQQREWDEIKRQIENSEPHFETLDEAMAYLRKRG